MVSISTFATFDRVVLPAFSWLQPADVVPAFGHLGPRLATSRVLPTVWPIRVVVRKAVELSSIAGSSTGLPDSIVCLLLLPTFELHEPPLQPGLIDLPEPVVSQHRLSVQNLQQLLWPGNPLRFPWQVALPVESLPSQSVPVFVPQPFLVAVATALPQLDRLVVTSVNHSRQLEDLTWNPFPSHFPVYQLPVTDQLGKHRHSVFWLEELPLENFLVWGCQAFPHHSSASRALTGLFLMRQHWRAFAHRVVTGPLLMVCRPLGQALIHRDSGRQASMRLFSLCPEQVDPVCFPPEAQPFSLPFCLSHRRFVGRRFQVARQLLAHFLLPVSMPPQVALAAPPTDVLDRQADSVDLVVRVARLPEARDAFSTIRSSDRKASALRLSAFVAPRQQRRLVSRRPQVPDLASKLFHFDFAVSLFQVNLQSDSFG